jgi:hypothetical protein
MELELKLHLPTQEALERFVERAARVRNRIEDECTRSVLAADHRTHSNWLERYEVADPRDGTAGDDDRVNGMAGPSELDARLFDVLHGARDPVPEWRESLDLFLREEASPREREMLAVYQEVFREEGKENISESWRRYRERHPETAPTSRRTFHNWWNHLRDRIREFAA